MKKFGGAGGFTLIEIVIVLAIIAVLASVLTPTLTRYVGDAKARKAEADTRNLGAAVGKFYADTGNWPIWASGSDTTADATKRNVLVTADGDQADEDTGITEWNGAGSDSFEEHLINNTPAYSTSGRRAWKGPYLGGSMQADPRGSEHYAVQADPWGSRYYANVKFLQPAHVGGTKPVFVLSPGPNKLIETQFEQTGPGITIGGDDIVFRLK